jgi:hypothetical protein
MRRIRITKNLLAALPEKVAEVVRDVQSRYPGIKSLTVRHERPGFELYLAEGEEYTVVYYDRTLKEVVVSPTVEMAAAHSGGAVGDMRIGTRVPLPPGSVVANVYYAGGYRLALINVLPDAALPDGDTILLGDAAGR